MSIPEEIGCGGCRLPGGSNNLARDSPSGEDGGSANPKGEKGLMLEADVAQAVYTRPKTLTELPTHYCPGCTHGVAHRLIAEVLEEMDVLGETIGVAPVGCSVFAYWYFDCDFVEAAHGRAPAMATGIKRVLPDRLVFTYQGDGDLASIGMAEIMHAAARGENISVFFINNAIYGMTGGQMAPTSLPGQITTSSPSGRDVEQAGYPVKMAELLANMSGAGYVVRRSLHDPKNIRLAKKAIRQAFEVQKAGLGFSMVELLSSCPTNWKLTPLEALRFIEERMIPVFPLGDFKVTG
jgi:2-oxoglutarate/2-oxoacid ferredoxin oxidoreductase subunit beta